MATGTLQDASIGYKAESVYGTPVVVDRFVEFVDESFEWDPKRVQGQGIRVGSKVARSAMRVTTQTSAKGDMTVEMTSKGLGTLLAACMGAGASTLVAGTTYPGAKARSKKLAEQAAARLAHEALSEAG